MNSDTVNNFSIRLNNKVLIPDKPIVMGILNLAPDSFYDGGKYKTQSELIKHTEKMIVEGATIIDIGAASSRPGSLSVTAEEELARLLPVIKTLKQYFPENFFSVDTYRSIVAEAAINEGIHMVNDISGGTFDPQMAETIGRLKVPYVMMHIQNTPKTMQHNPQYDDVVESVKDFFEQRLTEFRQQGVTENLVLDPGFGFGKTAAHNYRLLANLHVFIGLGYPVLVGLSRKSMINKILHTQPQEALNGTTALHVIALMNGANILRVHDVKEAMQAIELVEFYKQSS
jgi:dihydropteroate synthase